jgi:hypothetical protein
MKASSLLVAVLVLVHAVLILGLAGLASFLGLAPSLFLCTPRLFLGLALGRAPCHKVAGKLPLLGCDRILWLIYWTLLNLNN